ncbi:hypothetical protein BH09DEP1_BH09DEP1_2360 [soil metagenome]
MKKILLLLTGLALGSLCAAAEVPTEESHTHVITDLEEFAHAWAHAAVKDLNQDELELLGTFLYYDVAISRYELALRNALLDLQRGSQILSFKIMNLTNPQESLAVCAQLSALLEQVEKELAPARNYYLAAWQLCNKEIEQDAHKNLSIVIEQLQKMGQRALNNWAATNKNEIEKILENNSHKIEESIQQITGCKNALNDIVDGTFPLIDTDSEFVEIQTVNSALTISTTIYENLFKVSIATDEIMGISFGLINLNSIIFGALYQSFYEALEKKELVPMHIVINDQGFIPAELRTQTLPKLNLNAQPSA